MNPDEVVTLARYVRALCPQQRFDEYTPDAWGDVLARYSLDDARQAAATIAARQPFVAPSEIAVEITALRAARVERANLVYDGRPDETPAEAIARQRALTAAAADGRITPQTATQAVGATHRAALTGGPAPEVAARMREAFGDYLPTTVRDALAEYRPQAAARARAVTDGRPDALAVPCDWCKARAGQPCRQGKNRAARRQRPHPARIAAAAEENRTSA